MLAIGIGYCVIAPCYILPVVPAEVASKLKDKPVAALYRKPYFIQQSVGKDIDVTTWGHALSYINQNPDTYLVVRAQIYNQLGLNQVGEVLDRWPLWKRGNKAKDIFEAITNQNLDSLKEEMLLVKKRQL